MKLANWFIPPVLILISIMGCPDVEAKEAPGKESPQTLPKAVHGAGEGDDSAVSKNMQERLQGTGELLRAILAKDFQAARASAENKLDLPPEIEKEIASGGRRSSSLARSFHEDLAGLTNALKAEDREEALAKLDTVLKRCGECHRTLVK